jgi:arylsulfatase
MAYSADEACDVGTDTGSPASPDYGPSGNAFNGQIVWVQIDIGTDDHDHLIKPEGTPARGDGAAIDNRAGDAQWR